jgi:adenylate cyclase class 2
MHEIEIKLAFEDKQKVHDLLISLGFKSMGDETIEDTYYSQEASKLKDAKKFLRIRKKGDFSELTFKGEVESDRDVCKRVELNSGLKDSESMQKILECLGYNVIRKNKSNRQYYKFDNVEIVIVEYFEPVKLNYLEIEGPSEKSVMGVRDKLGDSVSDFPEDSFKKMDEI